LAGTTITTPNGSKNIEDIKIGDIVITYNTLTNKLENKRVFKIFEHPEEENGDHYLLINNKIKVTPNHPVYINGKIQKIEDAKIGDHIIGYDGKITEVKNIKKIYDKNIISYNIDTEDNRNYFADGILVHSGRLRNDFILHGMKITTPNGLKNIEDINIGDVVIGFNNLTKKMKKNKVIKKYEYLKEEMTNYYFIINNKIKIGPRNEIFVNNIWKKTEDLKIGDILYGENKKIIINSIKKVYERAKTYALEVEKNHNFFLGGVLVHNKPTTSCVSCGTKT